MSVTAKPVPLKTEGEDITTSSRDILGFNLIKRGNVLSTDAELDATEISVKRRH